MEPNLANLAQESTKGSIILVSGTIIATVISAVVSILIGRYLGPENYGLYSLALVVPQIFFLITDFGIREGIVKFTIEARTKGQTDLSIKIIKYGLLIRALAGIVFFVALFLSADFVSQTVLNRPNLGFLIRIASVSILFQAIFSTSTFAFMGLDKPVQSSIITQIQSIFKALVSIILVVLGYGIAGAVLGYVVGFVVAGIIGGVALYLFIKKYDKPIDFKEISPNIKKLLIFGAPLYFSFLMVGIMPQYVDILLAFFSSNYDIGNFKATANFMVLLSIVAQQLTASFLPVFTKLNVASTNQKKYFFNMSHKYLTLIIVPLTVLLITFSDEIVQFAYGSTYSDAGLYLSIYAILYFLTGLGYLNLPSLFNGMGKPKETLKFNIVAFVIILFVSPFTANLFGIVGLIITILIAYTIGTIYGMYKAKTILGITFDLKSLSRIYLISTLAVIPSFLLAGGLVGIQKILVGTALYFFVYITLIPIFRLITKREIQLIDNFLSNTKPLGLLKPIVGYAAKILQFTE